MGCRSEIKSLTSWSNFLDCRNGRNRESTLSRKVKLGRLVCLLHSAIYGGRTAGNISSSRHNPRRHPGEKTSGWGLSVPRTPTGSKQPGEVRHRLKPPTPLRKNLQTMIEQMDLEGPRSALARTPVPRETKRKHHAKKRAGIIQASAKKQKEGRIRNPGIAIWRRLRHLAKAMPSKPSGRFYAIWRQLR